MSESAILAAGHVEATEQTKLKRGPIAVDPLKVQEARDGRFDRLRKILPPRAIRDIERTPLLYRVLRVKAALGEASPRLAIKAKCQECVGYEEVRESVGNCRSFGCALWSYRPYQNCNSEAVV